MAQSREWQERLPRRSTSTMTTLDGPQWGRQARGQKQLPQLGPSPPPTLSAHPNEPCQ